MNIDAAKATLDRILPDLEAALRDHGSEQDVRLKVINRVLVEVCGWGYGQIKTEVANERGFADYALRDANTRTLCVLEAKKVGKLIIDTASTKKLEVQVGGSVLKKAKDGRPQEGMRYSGRRFGGFYWRRGRTSALAVGEIEGQATLPRYSFPYWKFWPE